MLDVAILGQVALGYSPFIDRNRSVSATRLTVSRCVPIRFSMGATVARAARRCVAGERRPAFLAK